MECSSVLFVGDNSNRDVISEAVVATSFFIEIDHAAESICVDDGYPEGMSAS